MDDMLLSAMIMRFINMDGIMHMHLELGKQENLHLGFPKTFDTEVIQLQEMMLQENEIKFCGALM